MSVRTLWSERLGMLLASGSPGSALAYQLGVLDAEARMVRRKIATSDVPPKLDVEHEPTPGDLLMIPARLLR